MPTATASKTKWTDPSAWLFAAIPAYQKSSSRDAGLTDDQLMALWQFADTGPITTSLTDLHRKLHETHAPDHRPRTPIGLKRLRWALKVLHKFRRPKAYRLVGHGLSSGNVTGTPMRLSKGGRLEQYRCGYVGIPSAQFHRRTPARRVSRGINANVIGIPVGTRRHKAGARVQTFHNYPYLGRGTNMHGRTFNLYRGKCV